jgi:hypothetical protein
MPVKWQMSGGEKDHSQVLSSFLPRDRQCSPEELLLQLNAYDAVSMEPTVSP